MNLLTNPFLTHGIDKLCTICHVILNDTNSTAHSIFSTPAELEFPMNLLQVLQSFSNFNFYDVPQNVCTTCYNKTIEVYKFIQMCNKAHENIKHYLKHVEIIQTIKDEMNVDVKVEEITIEPTSIIIDGQEFVEETENEIISKFNELGMLISGTEIKTEEIILQEGMEKEETSDNEEITISHIEIVTKEKKDSSDIDNLRVENIDDQLHDERMGMNKSKDCHLVISHKNELDDHQKEAKRTKEKTTRNEMCNALFGTKYNLRSHDQKDTLQRAHISMDLRPNRNRHQPLNDHEADVMCLECQEVFNNDKQLKLHMRWSHKKEFLCNDCGKVFTTKSRLITHIQMHSGDTRNEVKVKAHRCEQCDRRFTQAAHLRTHMSIHNGVKAHKCEQCDRRFSRAVNLRRHIDSHNGVKAHKCEQCDRRFTLAANLCRHMDSHKEIKTHKGEQCDRRFSRAVNLRRHIDSHNGVKAQKCEQCDRRFTLAANLSRHMDSHNEVKTHKGEQCDRRFTQSSSEHKQIKETAEREEQQSNNY